MYTTGYQSKLTSASALRIVHTSLRYPPAPGGTEDYVQQLVKGTRDVAAKRDVRVLTSALRTHHPLSPLNPKVLVDDPIYVQRLHHAGTPFISYPRLQALQYYLGHHQPDIVHGYSFWYQPADGAARYARRRTVPFIFHPMFYTNPIRRKPLWQLYQHTRGRATFAAADVVVIISPFEQQLIERLRFPVKRFVLLPPIIDSASLAEPHDNPFTARDINGRIIFAAARLAPGKGLEDAIDAFPQVRKKHPDIHLAIAGADFGKRSDLLRRARAYGIEQSVHLLGHLNRDELIGAYQHADVFLHPSYYEAFGIVIAEALAAGTPVVARNCSAIPYVAPHEVAALLFNNADEMVCHLTAILAEPAAGKKMADTGRYRVQQEFSLPVARTKLLQMYAELAR
ncbi:MAG: hypothetical protein COT71_00015 [Candidatus Andersenbacteria bacterium CG10_big_fil_rev_8_21_14_0_10_54_11]|uniref:Glycosyl transferase family 1 n=1 Tax=Candidatus Andersenbacteria bacterium CG10_big_fil_rev_8_21_14_0_10_54_11 TaxID=1974485 RepID=A0A2M6X0L6_9BACT|nr:MAG: hypothetical protein COT71_00015 [Candidatus Andersenbacteria bacterium CG10_big_fil_rev_8_21_14_0_10_54_11]